MIVRGAAHDANLPLRLPYTMSKVRKLPLNSLNTYLTCKLCRGYYIDATTIIECLHSFCRSCIVKYLETNKYCPICDVQVHKTKPLINIRQDKILQSIVYKMVPRLFQNEMLRRKSFYASHPEGRQNLDVEELGEAYYQHMLASDENICVALNYKGNPLTPRYLQCSAAVSIFHLQKLIRSKYDLSCNHRIDIFHEDDVLKSYLTLIDVAYSSLWRRKGPLELTYRIYESISTPPKIDIDINSPTPDKISSNNNNNNNASNDWKEVQIQISENGEMSVTGIQDCLDLLDKIDDKTQSVRECKSPKKDDDSSRLDLKSLKNNAKITKVELNQPIIDDQPANFAVDAINSVNLPTVTLTVAEIRELFKVEEAAKTQASDRPISPTTLLPPPAKKSKKDLPDLKFIGGTNKAQKKNGAKQASPQTKNIIACETPSIAQTTTSSSIVTTSPSKPVNSSSSNDQKTMTAATVVSSQQVVAVTSGTTTTTSAANNSSITSTAPIISKVKTSTSAVISQSNVPTTTAAKLTTSIAPSQNVQSTSKPATTDSTFTSSSNAINTTAKRKLPPSSDPPPVAAQKLPKPTILNHSLGLPKSLNLSKNHPLTTKQQKAVETAAKAAVNSNSTSSSNQTSKWSANAGSFKSYGTVINVPKVPPQATKQEQTATTASPQISSPTTMSASSSAAATVVTVTPSTADNSKSTTQQNDNSGTLMIKSKASTPIGYKTLKDPPKTWNPTLQQMHHHQKIGMTPGVGSQPGLKPGDLKNVRPAKFFKMRNNMPRYLGCPNSGVKPMFQVHVSPEKEKPNSIENTSTASHNQTTQSLSTTTATTTSVVAITTSPSIPIVAASSSTTKSGDQQIRKHSIVKIDPKTLKPISEKAPECSSLSTKSTISSKSMNEGGGDVKQQQEQQGSTKGSHDHKHLEKGNHSQCKTGNQQKIDQATSRPNQLTTSNSNLNLRINTTSVSITNPLKKSPHSPKKSTSPPNNQPTKGTSKPSSPNYDNKPPPNLNQQLNYTPSNPFIPNPLASPTLNPNQFNLLTAAVAAAQGFHHGYDPRYHHHHHLSYHHQLYPPPRLPFVGNWWGSQPAPQHQVPLSGSSVNRNSSPRGLIWNGPTTEKSICSPKEAKTATDSTKTSLSTKKDTITSTNTNSKESNIVGSAHERKEAGKSCATLPKAKNLSDVEEKCNKTAAVENKVEAPDKSDKVVPKSTSAAADSPKENVVLAVN